MRRARRWSHTPPHPSLHLYSGSIDEFREHDDASRLLGVGQCRRWMKRVKNITAFLESIGGGTLEGLYQPDQVRSTSGVGDTTERYLLGLTRNDNPLPRALEGLRQVRVERGKLHLRPAQELGRCGCQCLKIRVRA